MHNRYKVIGRCLDLGPLQFLKVNPTANVLTGATTRLFDILPQNSDVSITINSLMLMVETKGVEDFVHGNANSLTRDIKIKGLSALICG